MDKRTHEWLDRWISNTRHSSTNKVLAPLVNNADDWNHLRSQKYAGDDMLKFCAFRRLKGLGHHIVCSLIHDCEISALTEGKPTPLHTPDKLRLHLRLLVSNDQYKRACYSKNKPVEWEALRSFFFI
uniref:Uncharacterized protein n=1 Tax=Peronospora matthiolae TaxID=2874970 RepID=A0AAV1TCM0_9STRA